MEAVICSVCRSAPATGWSSGDASFEIPCCALRHCDDCAPVVMPWHHKRGCRFFEPCEHETLTEVDYPIVRCDDCGRLVNEETGEVVG